jgi:hypothetical protein
VNPGYEKRRHPFSWGATLVTGAILVKENFAKKAKIIERKTIRTQSTGELASPCPPLSYTRILLINNAKLFYIDFG